MQSIDGQCRFGRVTYRATIDPARISICHCTDCQNLTGLPFRVTVLYSRAQIEMTSEQPDTCAKTGESGAVRFQHFCATCGTRLVTSGDGSAVDDWGIRWGQHRATARFDAIATDLVPLGRAVA